MVFPFSKLEFLLAYKSSIAIKLWLGVLVVNYLAVVSKHFIILSIFSPNSSKHACLVVLGSVFNSNNFLYPTNSELLLELQTTLRVELLEIKPTILHFLLEELASVLLSEELHVWSIECFLDFIKFVLWLLSKEVLVNAPKFKFEFQHLKIILLLFIHLATISNVVNHQIECQRIPVYEDFVVKLLHNVTSRKHGLKRTTLDMAEGRSAHAEIILATYIQLENVIKGLYLLDLFLLILPGLLLLFNLLSLRLQLGPLILYLLF